MCLLLLFVFGTTEPHQTPSPLLQTHTQPNNHNTDNSLQAGRVLFRNRHRPDWVFIVLYDHDERMYQAPAAAAKPWVDATAEEDTRAASRRR